MRGNVAVLVGCRLISIWYLVNTVLHGSAWVRTALQMRANYGIRDAVADPLAYGILTSIFIALLLWYAAPWLARQAGPASEMPTSSDITNGLVRALGAYFVISALAEIVQYVAFTTTSGVAEAYRIIRGETLAQSITYLVCGVVLIIGVDKIRMAMGKVAKYGLDEPPEARND